MKNKHTALVQAAAPTADRIERQSRLQIDHVIHRDEIRKAEQFLETAYFLFKAPLEDIKAITVSNEVRRSLAPELQPPAEALLAHVDKMQHLAKNCETLCTARLRPLSTEDEASTAMAYNGRVRLVMESFKQLRDLSRQYITPQLGAVESAYDRVMPHAKGTSQDGIAQIGDCNAELVGVNNALHNVAGFISQQFDRLVTEYAEKLIVQTSAARRDVTTSPSYRSL